MCSALALSSMDDGAGRVERRRQRSDVAGRHLQIAAEVDGGLLREQHRGAVGQQLGEGERTGRERGGQHHRACHSWLCERSSEPGQHRRWHPSAGEAPSTKQCDGRACQYGERSDDRQQRKALRPEVGVGHLGADLLNATDAVQAGVRGNGCRNGEHLPGNQPEARSMPRSGVDESRRPCRRDGSDHNERDDRSDECVLDG